MLTTRPSSSPPKRTKSPVVRIVGSRIYDPKNGKTCHQCRQKTMDFVVTCTNESGNKKCPLNVCRACLLDRMLKRLEYLVSGSAKGVEAFDMVKDSSFAVNLEFLQDFFSNNVNL
ncbi:putative Zinc-finger domain of monoamine-oxidase A repressor R1 [Helianthus anomalus]